MYQHSSTAIKPFLYEGIASREVLKDVLILHVVNFDDEVLVALEEITIKGQAKYRDHVCNISLLQGFLSP